MFCRTSNPLRVARQACAGFTLAEVLAAMLFMAIVIPVAVAGLRLAGAAGEVGVRKAVAARIAESLINELAVTGQARKSAQWGTIQEGGVDYGWSIQVEPSALAEMRLAVVQVTFPVQGQEYDVRLSTLVDTTR